MLSRATMHGVLVALVVVLAVEVPYVDLYDRPAPRWLTEVCQDFEDVCDGTSGPATGTP